MLFAHADRAESTRGVAWRNSKARLDSSTKGSRESSGPCLERSHRDPFAAPKRFKAKFGGHVLRPVWNRLEIRSPTEHFHEFLIDILKRTLSDAWIRAEIAKPESERHVVGQWLIELSELTKRNTPENHKPGELLSTLATGGVTSLILLARDLYLLQITHQVPDKLVRRLRSRELFQGARYEVAVAAALILGGFEIEWIKAKAVKHCEFYASHDYTKERIAVEAKSRHRAGVLHTEGQAAPPESADLSRLFKSAFEQAPGDAPFAVFIDVNLPYDGDIETCFRSWGSDAAAIAEPHGRDESAPAPFALATFTNFGWHYHPGEEVRAGAFGYQYRPQFSAIPLTNPLTQHAIVTGFDRYPRFPEDEPEVEHHS